MSRRRASRMAREEAGQLVFDAIADASSFITARDLALVTGLSGSQVTNGIAYIKEVFADEVGEPLIASHEGFKFAEDVEETRAYASLRMRTSLTQTERMITGTFLPAVSKFPRSRQVQRLYRDLVRVQEDMSDVLTEADA